MALLNYTTKIEPDKTASEIARILSAHGVQAVLTEYDPETAYISALSFKIARNGQSLGFRLPCDWKPVQKVLERQRQSGGRGSSKIDIRREAAVRVAWRIVKDWVEAQMALVETQMVTTAEVFLPYAVMKDGRTLAQHAQTNAEFLLGGGQ